MKCVWNTNFFTRQATAKTFFLLHSNYKGNTPYWVWFGLDNSKTQSLASTLKIRYSRNSQISVWKPKFCRQAIAKVLFVLHCTFTGDALFRVWFNLNNLLTQWKKPIFKIPYSRILKSSVWNTNFFTRQAIAKIPSVQHSSYTGDTPGPVSFHLDNSMTQSKRTIFKICYSRNSKSSVWNAYEILTFLLGKL